MSMGYFGTPLHNVWRHMLDRCRNPNNKFYERYGGRGITVCKAWHEFPAFYTWAQVNGYKPGLTIERDNVDGNYEPNNCSFIPRREQGRNTSRTVLIEGKCMMQWCEDNNVDYDAFRRRLQRGWPLERAIKQPYTTRRKTT